MGVLWVMGEVSIVRSVYIYNYIYMVYNHPEVCRKWIFQNYYRFSELCFYILPLI